MPAREFRTVCGMSAEGKEIVGISHRPTGKLLTFKGINADENARESIEEISNGGSWKSFGKDFYGCLGAIILPGLVGNILFYVTLTEVMSVGKITSSTEIFKITAVELIPTLLNAKAKDPTLLNNIIKLLTQGSFYVSANAVESIKGFPTPRLPGVYKFTNRWQTQAEGSDTRFFWNRSMWRELERRGAQCQQWAMVCIRGSVALRTIYIGEEQARAAVISRLSCQRAGQRFLTRGIDDDGNAANFVETEQLLLYKTKVLSFIQVRGSVPIFWDQPGIQIGSNRVRLTRGFDACQPAFERHVDTLLANYGDVMMLSLLSQKESEAQLNSEFEAHAKACPGLQRLHFKYRSFDFNAECRKSNLLKAESLFATTFQSFLQTNNMYINDGSELSHDQIGILRTNCLDCLERTNTMQGLAGMQLLQKMLENLRLDFPEITDSKCNQIRQLFKTMWKHNGDNISRCITGTGNVKSDSAIKGIQRSATRVIQNNFLDAPRQRAVDALLGVNVEYEPESNHIGDLELQMAVNLQLDKVRAAFTTQHDVTCAVVTWNLAGGKHIGLLGTECPPLSELLLDPFENESVDIYAIGFQEAVDLTAKNMAATDKSNKKELEVLIAKTFAEKYKILYSLQLVGVCLFVYAKTDLLAHVTGVVSDTVKTGVGGKVGNKGGVAIRFRLHSTSICIVCTHLASGQSHTTERNADYLEIYNKLDFKKGRKVDNHDHIFWMGDLNYRIDKDIEVCKNYLIQKNLAPLLLKDQLTVQRKKNNVFNGFLEKEIKFEPTYKYDMFSDEWDSSDKQRCPAWTDRILFKTTDKQHHKCFARSYDRNDTLQISDHRAVYALLSFTVDEINKEARNQALQNVCSSLQSKAVTVTMETSQHEIVNELGELFSTFGAIDHIWNFTSGGKVGIIYETDEAALGALTLDATSFEGALLSVVRGTNLNGFSDEVFYDDDSTITSLTSPQQTPSSTPSSTPTATAIASSTTQPPPPALEQLFSTTQLDNRSSSSESVPSQRKKPPSRPSPLKPPSVLPATIERPIRPKLLAKKLSDKSVDIIPTTPEKLPPSRPDALPPPRPPLLPTTRSNVDEGDETEDAVIDVAVTTSGSQDTETPVDVAEPPPSTVGEYVPSEQLTTTASLSSSPLPLTTPTPTTTTPPTTTTTTTTKPPTTTPVVSSRVPPSRPKTFVPPPSQSTPTTIPTPTKTPHSTLTTHPLHEVDNDLASRISEIDSGSSSDNNDEPPPPYVSPFLSGIAKDFDGGVRTRMRSTLPPISVVAPTPTPTPMTPVTPPLPPPTTTPTPTPTTTSPPSSSSLNSTPSSNVLPRPQRPTSVPTYGTTQPPTPTPTPTTTTTTTTMTSTSIATTTPTTIPATTSDAPTTSDPPTTVPLSPPTASRPPPPTTTPPVSSSSSSSSSPNPLQPPRPSPVSRPPPPKKEMKSPPPRPVLSDAVTKAVAAKRGVAAFKANLNKPRRPPQPTPPLLQQQQQ